MSYYAVDRRLDCAVVMGYSTTTNDSVSVGGKVPINTLSDMIGSAASTLSVSSNEITLPSGYWWFVKGSPQVYTANGYISYQWYDTDNTTAYGRRGFMSMQERAWLEGGEELSTCLLDCTSAAKTIFLKVLSQQDTSTFNTTDATHSPYCGRTRVEFWRLG